MARFAVCNLYIIEKKAFNLESIYTKETIGGLRTAYIMFWMRILWKINVQQENPRIFYLYYGRTAYNIIRLMQIDARKDIEFVIDVIDEITEDFSVALTWIFDPIPSFY